MQPDEALEMFVIYDHPTDYPDHFVVRRFLTKREGVFHDKLPLMLAPTLKRARRAIPLHCFRIERSPEDDPKIVETWV